MRIEHIGDATLYLGDCLEILPTLGRVDAVVTDPPYTSPTTHAFGRRVIKRLSDLAIQEFYFTEIKRLISGCLKENSPFISFCDDIYSAVLTGLFYDWQQTALLIWDKGSIGMGNPFRKQHELIFYANRGSVRLSDEVSYIPTVLKYPLEKEYHAAEKPVALIEKLILGLTKNEEIILDPFMGSASTGIASLNNGRKYIGVELDPIYFDIACRRIEDAYKQPRLFDDPKPAYTQGELA